MRTTKIGNFTLTEDKHSRGKCGAVEIEGQILIVREGNIVLRLNPAESEELERQLKWLRTETHTPTLIQTLRSAREGVEEIVGRLKKREFFDIEATRGFAEHTVLADIDRSLEELKRT